jgi:predicted nucleotidyltransferase
MSYNISSDQFNNPLLKELLVKLSTFFASIGSEFYIIGATARDIVLSGIHRQIPGRKTDDLDIAIAIPDWIRYQEISESLCKVDGFHKSKSQKQRFLYNDIYMLDIVPFGEIAKVDHNIYWPPEETHAMSVAGFTEVLKRTIAVTVDDTITVYVATLPGIFILKLNAWNDRNIETNRDAEDMAYIITNYLEINEERAATENYDLFAIENFSKFIAGATLMGRDIKDILRTNPEILKVFLTILKLEISKKEESLLINQIIETHSSLKFEDVYNGLLSLTNELSN